ncbi:50S ribosomal protein L28 [Candidatus Peregrinibacteria bacterium]|nr:50S ribosomal protein L28 [Candidatus Peregrinibacteria bacterium]
MSRICEITGRKTSTGNTRSHAMNHSNRKYLPNLMKKTIIDPITGKKTRMRISARGLKTLCKAR